MGWLLKVTQGSLPDLRGWKAEARTYTPYSPYGIFLSCLGKDRREVSLSPKKVFTARSKGGGEKQNNHRKIACGRTTSGRTLWDPVYSDQEIHSELKSVYGHLGAFGSAGAHGSWLSLHVLNQRHNVLLHLCVCNKTFILPELYALG